MQNCIHQMKRVLQKIKGTRYYIAAVIVSLVLLSSGMLATNAHAQLSSGLPGTMLQQALGPTPIPANVIPTTGPNLPTSNATMLQTVPIPVTTNYTISRSGSGLVASDSFTNTTQTQQQLQSSKGYWTYGGDAPAEKAPYAFWRDTQGLHIGAQAPADGVYAGFYAVTPQTTAMLYHVKVAIPVSTIPTAGDLYENGMYVQNGTMDVNYVTCTSVTSNIGTQWALVAANGNIYGANTYKSLWWTGMTPAQPLTADCTIITNGTNYLKLYINGVNVYESRNLNLNMSSDLITFMEPQSSYAGKMLNGTFQNFYATSGGNVTVTGNPAGASTVKLVQPTSSGQGNVVASSQVDSTGKAVLYTENLAMPVHAYVVSYDSHGNPMASTSRAVDIYGGDSYMVSGSSLSYTAGNTNPLPAPTGLAATTVSQYKINLNWSAPSAPVTGYKIERMAGNNATWSTIVQNTGSAATAYSDAGLTPSTTYTYRVSAVYATATSASTSTASATTLASTYNLTVASHLDTGGSLTGLFTVLANSTGQVVATGFTPAIFTLNTSAQYFVTVGNYGPWVFDHWQDTGATSAQRPVSISSDTTLIAVFKDVALVLSPSSGHAGSTVTVTGTMFASNHAIQLSFDGASLVTAPPVVTTNSTGGFAATFVVPGTASSGSHTVSATDGTSTHSALFTVN